MSSTTGRQRIRIHGNEWEGELQGDEKKVAAQQQVGFFGDG